MCIRDRVGMRAVICDEFGSFEKMNVKDVPEPKLRPNEVLIDVKAAGVSFAQSLKVAGKYRAVWRRFVRSEFRLYHQQNVRSWRKPGGVPAESHRVSH